MENTVIKLGPTFNYMITGLLIIAGAIWLAMDVHGLYMALVLVGIPVMISNTVLEIDPVKRKRRVAYVFYLFYIGGWYDFPEDDSIELNKSSYFQRNSWTRYTSTSGYVHNFSVVLKSSAGDIELFTGQNYLESRERMLHFADLLQMPFTDHFEEVLREREAETGRDLTPGF